MPPTFLRCVWPLLSLSQASGRTDKKCKKRPFYRGLDVGHSEKRPPSASSSAGRPRKAQAARHHGSPSLLASPPRRDSPPQLARPQFAFVQAARPGLGESLATSLARDFAQVRYAKKQQPMF